MDPGLTDEERRTLREKARASVLEAVGRLGGEAERGRILACAVEIGGFTDRERAAPSPTPKYPCLLEHQLSWALTDGKRKGRLLNPRTGVWALRPPETVPLAAPFQAERVAELRAMPYRQYLRTPEWKETRAAALARANHCCSLNVQHEGPMHVHHNNYDRLGEELASDLVVLCETCHERHHEADGRPRRPASRAESVPPPTVSAAPAPSTRPSLLRRLLG